jgi:hypothetical protein
MQLFSNNQNNLQKPKSFIDKFGDLFQPRMRSPIPNDPIDRSFMDKIKNLFMGENELNWSKDSGYVPNPTPTPNLVMKWEDLPEGGRRGTWVEPTPTGKQQPIIKPTITPTNTPSPTITPTPTAIPPVSSYKRIEPYPIGPETPDRSKLYPKLQTKETYIQPEVFDAIMKHVKGDLKQRLALATVYQESTGGLNPIGDNGQSFGPAHIQPGNAPPIPGWRQPTKAEAMDPEYTAKYLNAFMDYNELNLPPEKVMRRWNFNSGYLNKGPKYDEDIPRFATMSALIRSDKR